MADRPFWSLKAKIRAITGRTSQQDLAPVLIRLTQLMRGWANYFKRGRQACLRQARRLRVVAADPHAAGPSPLELGRRPPPVHHPHGAMETDRSGRARTVPDCLGHGQPLPIPARGPHPMAACEPRLPAETVESPLR
ncbi:group II intron maturase-specific domain-containing protein [Streptomyces sp. NPDC001351]|uniref:group II intron maturase-specific domain-containing protein n=1 Tax=Streptomyces sp. NPDC001351 TaxID=3364564 RepID=UPI0036BC2BAD